MRKYLDMLETVLEDGTHHEDRTGTGTTRIFGHMQKFDLSEGFPLLTTKKMFLRGLCEELRWFIRGSTDVTELQDRNVHIWDEWTNADNGIGPGYGFQWRAFGARYSPETKKALFSEHAVDDLSDYLMEDKRIGNVFNTNGRRIFGVDQLREVVDACVAKSQSRRIILSAWNPVNIPDMELPPCHVMYQFEVWGDTLHMIMYQRSCDIFLGVPFNIAESAMLLSLIAKVSGLTPGVFTHMYGDLHIYDNHKEQVTIQLDRIPRKLPTLKLNDRLAGKGFDGLLDFVWEDVTITGYNPHDRIKGDVSV